MNTQYINLDISKALKPNRSITIGQGDLGGTTIVATIYDNGSLLSLSGLSARFFLRLPDSLGYVEDNNCTVSGNAITYVVDEEHCASVSGVTQDAYFALYSGTTRIYSTERFTVKILQSAADGVQPAGSWTNGVEEWLENASETLSGYVSDSNARIGATINSANAAVEQMRSDMDSAIGDAIEGTEDVIERAEDAIDAMGDISELAVPLMTPDTRGGAKLGDGLAVDDGTLHVGQLAKASTGEVYGPLASVTAKGHAEQFSTTGKNLVPNTNNTTSITSNGVTFTKNSDGSITLNGTATKNAQFTGEHIDLDAGTYTLSIGTSFPSGVWVSVSNAQPMIHPGETSKTATVNALSDAFLFIYIYSGTSFSNFRIYPQLELGSVATEYEPYTGGAPSPSPDYPQEIKVVRGRNLLDTINSASGRNLTVNGIAYSVLSDGGIHVSGTATSDNTYFNVYSKSKLLTGLSAGETYVLSKSASVNIDNISVNIGKITGDTNTYVTGMSTKQSARFIAEDVDGYIVYLQVRSGNTVDAIVYPQLELGSVAHGYMPYGNYVGLEVQGKNMAHCAPSGFVNGVSWIVGNDGKVSVSGRQTSSWNIPFNRITLTAGTYTLSTKTALPSNTFLRIIKTSDSSRLANIEGQAKSVTFTLSEVTQVYVFAGSISTTSGISVSGTIVAQLELGSTATDYEPYFPHSTIPIPLPQRGWVGGLPDGTSDVLSIDSAGKVEWEMGTNETVFDGVNKVMTGVDTTQEIPMFWSQATLDSAKASNGVAFFSSHFIAREVSGSSTALRNNEAVFGWSRGDINPLLRLRTLKFSTVADFNTWLQSNPVTVLYPLATPVTEDCGYVDLPDIPSEATVSIPELEDLGLTFWVDGDGTIRAAMREWYERAHSEYADRITNLESAVAQLVTEG